MTTNTLKSKKLPMEIMQACVEDRKTKTFTKRQGISSGILLRTLFTFAWFIIPGRSDVHATSSEATSGEWRLPNDITEMNNLGGNYNDKTGGPVINIVQQLSPKNLSAGDGRSMWVAALNTGSPHGTEQNLDAIDAREQIDKTWQPIE